jgi:hypothetical protein
VDAALSGPPITARLDWTQRVTVVSFTSNARRQVGDARASRSGTAFKRERPTAAAVRSYLEAGAAGCSSQALALHPQVRRHSLAQPRVFRVCQPEEERVPHLCRVVDTHAVRQ